MKPFSCKHISQNHPHQLVDAAELVHLDLASRHEQGDPSWLSEEFLALLTKAGYYVVCPGCKARVWVTANECPNCGRAKKLFARLGDQADYVAHESLKDFAKDAEHYGVSGPVAWAANCLGISCNDFEGDNYISLFWALEADTPMHGLSPRQLDKLNALLP